MASAFKEIKAKFRGEDIRVIELRLTKLEELPIGNFVEIEGADFQSIRRSATDLNLKWELRIDSAYLTI